MNRNKIEVLDKVIYFKKKLFLSAAVKNNMGDGNACLLWIKVFISRWKNNICRKKTIMKKNVRVSLDSLSSPIPPFSRQTISSSIHLVRSIRGCYVKFVHKCKNRELHNKNASCICRIVK